MHACPRNDSVELDERYFTSLVPHPQRVFVLALRVGLLRGTVPNSETGQAEEAGGSIP